MREATSIHDIHQVPTTRSALDAVLYEGAMELLQVAIEAEVSA